MITNDYKTRVKNGILELKNKGLSQPKIAVQLGAGDAYISNILNDKWEHISDEYWRKLGSGLRIENKWVVQPMTANFKVIFNLCNDACDYNKFVALTAYTGAGKTETLKMYKKANPTTSAYILCEEDMTRKDFIQEIQKAIGVEFSGNLRSQRKQICDWLIAQNKFVLLFDEADKLRDPIFRVIKMIFDLTENKAGILIAGTPVLLENINRKAKRNVIGFREFKRRIMSYKSVKGFKTQYEDVKKICRANGLNVEKYIKKAFDESTNFGELKYKVQMMQIVQQKNTAA